MGIKRALTLIPVVLFLVGLFLLLPQTEAKERNSKPLLMVVEQFPVEGAKNIKISEDTKQEVEKVLEKFFKDQGWQVVIDSTEAKHRVFCQILGHRARSQSSEERPLYTVNVVLQDIEDDFRAVGWGEETKWDDLLSTLEAALKKFTLYQRK